jgi:hypothetical protein
MILKFSIIMMAQTRGAAARRLKCVSEKGHNYYLLEKHNPCFFMCKNQENSKPFKNQQMP